MPKSPSTEIVRRTLALAVAFATLALSGCSSSDTPPTTPEGTEVPSPSPSAEAPGPVADVIVSGFALPMTDEVWDEVEPGWLLVDYMPAVLGRSDDVEPFVWVQPITDAGERDLLLVSPDGDRYLVMTLPSDPMFELEAWRAGETVAYVRRCNEPGWCVSGGQSGWLLDLTTGELTQEDVPEDRTLPAHISVLPDGSLLWGDDGNYITPETTYLVTGTQDARVWTPLGVGWHTYGPVVSPDGDYVALGRNASSSELIVSLRDGTTMTTPDLGGDWYCNPWEWTELGVLSSFCSDVEAGTAMTTRFEVTTETFTPGTAEEQDFSGSPSHGQVDPFILHDRQIDYGLYTGIYDDGSPYDQGEPRYTPLGIDDHGELTIVELPGYEGMSDHLRVEDVLGHVFLLSGCLDFNQRWFWYDLDSGMATELVEGGLDSCTYESGLDQERRSIFSVVVGR